MKQFLIRLFMALVLSLSSVTGLYAQQSTEAGTAAVQGAQADGHQAENPSAPQEHDEPAGEPMHDANHDASQDTSQDVHHDTNNDDGDNQLFKTDSASDSSDAGERPARQPRTQNAADASTQSAGAVKPADSAAGDPSRPTVTATDVAVKEPAVQSEEAAADGSADEAGELKVDEPVSPKTPNLLPGRKPWSFYKPLLERNIFTRQQPRKTTSTTKTPPASTTPVAPAKPPAPNWVLTGIVINEQGNYAFFENSQTNVTLRISAGQTLGDSRVQTIGHDHVLLAASSESDSEQRVDVGSTLDGSTASLGAPSSGSIFGESTPDTTTTGSAAASDTPAVDPDKMSIIERMRARRQREGGR